MKVLSIKLDNILGLKQWSLDPEGPITVITGHNAAGKSSALKGIQALLDRGNLALLKNVDAGPDEKAEGVLVLEGDAGKMIIKKDEKGLSVKTQIDGSAAFKDVPAPQRFLSALFDAPAANPVSFLTCKDKDRVNLLLEALDLEYSPGDLWARMDLSPEDFPAVPTGIQPLKEIAYILKGVFDKRTGVNVTEKAKRSTVQQTRLKIPAEVPTIEDVGDKEAALETLRAEYATGKEKAQTSARIDKAAAIVAINDTEKQNRFDLAAIDDALKLEMAQRMDAAKKEASAKLSEAHAAATVACDAADERLQFEMAKMDGIRSEGEQLGEELATIREQQKDQIRIVTLHDQANTQEAEADELLLRSGKLTIALQALDNYKAGMISDLPIPGLDVTDNVVSVDGVPWDQLNTEKRIGIAVMVSCLRFKGDFKPVFIDGFEALDERHRELTKAKLKEAGATAFIAQVTDGDLEAGK